MSWIRIWSSWVNRKFLGREAIPISQCGLGDWDVSLWLTTVAWMVPRKQRNSANNPHINTGMQHENSPFHLNMLSLVIIPKPKVGDIRTGVVLTCSHLLLSQRVWKPKLYLSSFLSCLPVCVTGSDGRRPWCCLIALYLRRGASLEAWWPLRKTLVSERTVRSSLQKLSFLFVCLCNEMAWRGEGKELLLYKNNKINFLLVFICGSVFWGGCKVQLPKSRDAFRQMEYALHWFV